VKKRIFRLGIYDLGLSMNSFWMKISLWLFRIQGFEGGIGVPKRGGPLNSTGAGLLNHQTSKISINSIWMKISLWVFKIRGLKVEFGFPSMGDPIIPPGWNC
jgi:hypothetical protein